MRVVAVYHIDELDQEATLTGDADEFLKRSPPCVEASARPFLAVCCLPCCCLRAVLLCCTLSIGAVPAGHAPRRLGLSVAHLTMLLFCAAACARSHTRTHHTVNNRTAPHACTATTTILHCQNTCTASTTVLPQHPNRQNRTAGCAHAVRRGPGALPLQGGHLARGRTAGDGPRLPGAGGGFVEARGQILPAGGITVVLDVLCCAAVRRRLEMQLRLGLG